MDVKLRDQAINDPEFVKFVNAVNPKQNGVQPVFFAELFLILKILYEVYTWMKALGWFDRWLKRQEIKKIMRLPTQAMREQALVAFKAKAGIQ